MEILDIYDMMFLFIRHSAKCSLNESLCPFVPNSLFVPFFLFLSFFSHNKVLQEELEGLFAPLSPRKLSFHWWLAPSAWALLGFPAQVPRELIINYVGIMRMLIETRTSGVSVCRVIFVLLEGKKISSVCFSLTKVQNQKKNV